MEFSKLRSTLENKNIEKKEIDIIVSLVDKKLLRANEIKADREIGKNLFYGGLILSVLSIVFSIITLLGIYDLGGYGVIMYGPIIFGFLLIVKGRNKMNRKY